MKTIRISRTVLLFLLPLFLLSSCSSSLHIEKRRYNKGWYIQRPLASGQHRDSGAETSEANGFAGARSAAGSRFEQAVEAITPPAVPELAAEQQTSAAVPVRVLEQQKRTAILPAVKKNCITAERQAAGVKQHLRAGKQNRFSRSSAASSSFVLGMVAGIVLCVILVVAAIIAINKALDDLTDACCSMYDIY